MINIRTQIYAFIIHTIHSRPDKHSGGAAVDERAVWEYKKLDNGRPGIRNQELLNITKLSSSSSPFFLSLPSWLHSPSRTMDPHQRWNKFYLNFFSNSFSGDDGGWRWGGRTVLWWSLGCSVLHCNALCHFLHSPWLYTLLLLRCALALGTSWARPWWPAWGTMKPMLPGHSTWRGARAKVKAKAVRLSKTLRPFWRNRWRVSWNLLTTKKESGDLYVLYMMGWINDGGGFNEETFEADVMTLLPSWFTPSLHSRLNASLGLSKDNNSDRVSNYEDDDSQGVTDDEDFDSKFEGLTSFGFGYIATCDSIILIFASLGQWPPHCKSEKVSFEAVGEEEKKPTNYKLDPQIYDSSFCHWKPPSVLHPSFQRDTWRVMLVKIPK